MFDLQVFPEDNGNGDSKEPQINYHKIDFSENFWDSTKETIRVLYSNRDPITGETTEDINAIIYRVAQSVAMAELKYILTPQEIIWINLDGALKHPAVAKYTDLFARCMGNQIFWANTPANINAEPEVSLNVLKYWAHGKLAGLDEVEIWKQTENFDDRGIADKNIFSMRTLAKQLKGKGCLAACGVAFVTDSLDGIQEAARIETMATKAAMGMGLNTSALRPWSTIVANGAAASGPDRFYEKSISKAVEAVAQGGRRGGALIELRNSDHPDILFFIDKKRLTPPPDFAKLYKANCDQSPIKNQDAKKYASEMMQKTYQDFGKAYAEYLTKQSYLKNTNITVLAMPGFMQAVEKKQWYQCTFAGKPWTGKVYDPRKVLPGINPLTKENLLEEYSVDLNKYPEALNAANEPDCVLDGMKMVLKGHLYAPEVFDRIVENMQDSGEPGIAFYEHINDANANSHVYDLNTCNPCGEQFLPAGLGKDGNTYMGNCNLSSLHAAHPDFFGEDGEQKFFDAVALQQRFMDNVTDVSWYPISAQNVTARLERRNGGGFAGIAEYLSRKGVRFGSVDGLLETKNLFKAYTNASVRASMDLAQERGVYPLWEGSKFDTELGLKVRNSCMVNNAPTGTLAQAMQTSWGIDPHNGIVFSRKVRSRYVDFVAPGFEEAMRKYNAWPETEEGVQELKQKIRENGKSVKGLSCVPIEVQKAFPIRIEITPGQYIDHLAAIHDGTLSFKYAFNSVSNTCSIPLGFDAEEIKAATIDAWKLGVKDLTFYPDGSRLSQPVEKIATEEHEQAGDIFSMLNMSQKRKLNLDETYGHTYKVKIGDPSGSATMHVTLNSSQEHPDELLEAYFRVGKSGALDSGYCEAIGRLCSSFLQYAAQFGPEEREKVENVIVKQLINVSSDNQAFYKFPGADKPVLIKSPCDGLAKAILHFRKTSKVRVVRHIETESVVINNNVSKDLCPNCNDGQLINIDGCTNCDTCGFSKC
jgi:ribonucleoside-diphosphate reductase alpha chain